MAVRRWRKLAILHKIEATYGTDAAPTAANAIVAKNVTFTPMEGEEVSRDLMLPYMGNQGMVLAGIYGRIEFDVELAGAGAAGTIPKYGSILRVAGFSETVTAGVDVTYSIIEDAVESGSLYFVSDKVRHVLLGGQCNIAFNWTPKAYPYMRVTYLGLLGTITDVALMPTVTLAGWTTPKVVSKANTVLTLHSGVRIAESVALDLGNTVTPRFLIGDERMLISDRSGTGTAVVQADALSNINWFQKALDRERGDIGVVHGSAAGNIVDVSGVAVEIGRPTQGQTNGIINYSLPLAVCADQGLDDLTIVVR